MSTLYKRHTKFSSKFESTKDVCLTINDIEVIVEFSYHGIGRGKERAVFDSAVILMIQRAFDDILDLNNDERFIIIDKEMHISFVGAIKAVGTDVLVTVVSVIDSIFPHNPYGTLEVVI